MEAGLPLFVLKRLLGHTSLSTTSKYLHVSREHLAQIKSPLDQPADPVPRRAPPSVAPSPTPYPARPSPKLAAVVSPFDELLTAAETLLSFGRNNLGAQLGVTAVLHTWSQTLRDHYHLHCIVSGGGCFFVCVRLPAGAA